MYNRKLTLSVVLIGLFLFCGCGARRKPQAVPAQPKQETLPSASAAAIDPSARASLSAGLPTQPEVFVAPRSADEVAPGNLIEVLCVQDEKIAGKFRVAFDGTVQLPYEVKVSVADKSLDQAKAAISQGYAKFFRNSPTIGVQIAERKYYVRASGLVDKPGEYLVSEGGSLDEVIGQAGGLQKGPDQRPIAQFARIQSGGVERIIKLGDFYSGTAGAAITWRGGDTVSMQNVAPNVSQPTNSSGVNKNYIQMLGQVRSPGEFMFKENSNLLYYLVQAGGPTDRANTNDMVLLRDEGGVVKTYPFSLDEPETVPALQGGDVVMLQAENRSELEKDTSVFGSIGAVIASLATAILVGVGL